MRKCLFASLLYATNQVVWIVYTIPSITGLGG